MQEMLDNTEQGGMNETFATCCTYNLDDWFKPAPGQSMVFWTTVLAEPIELIPFHRLFDQRYCVYWSVVQ